MKQIQIAEFGAPEVLACVDREPLFPSPYQVVLRVACAGLNPVDYKTRKGLGFVAEKVREKLPWTPGYDVAGIITAKGNRVTGWEIGQRVCGMVNFPLPAGAYSQEVAVNPELLASVPEEIADEVAAAIPLAGLTAWQGLIEVGNLCSGQNVLVLAAAGGVGHLAVQLAMKAGAQVWGTASPANEAFLNNLGVRYVNYHESEALTSLPEMDLVFDTVGGATGESALAFLREGGVLVTLPTISAEAIAKAAQFQGKTALGYTVHPDAKQLQNLLQLVAEGQLRVEVSKTFDIEQTADAHRLLESGHVRGKLVLTIDPQCSENSLNIA
jgi:NADPH:quinone reductase